MELQQLRRADEPIRLRSRPQRFTLTTFTRDKLGRITTKTETIQGVTDNYAYGYDTAGRLETVTKNGTSDQPIHLRRQRQPAQRPANHESRTPNHLHLRRPGPAALHSGLSTQHSVLLQSQRRTAIQDQRHPKPRTTNTTSSATSATSHCPMGLRSTTSSMLKTAASAKRSTEPLSKAGSTGINSTQSPNSTAATRSSAPSSTAAALTFPDYMVKGGRHLPHHQRPPRQPAAGRQHRQRRHRPTPRLRRIR